MLRADRERITHHHRGFIGTYVRSERESLYECEYVSEDGGDVISTSAPNRLMTLVDWVLTVNFHLRGTADG